MSKNWGDKNFDSCFLLCNRAPCFVITAFATHFLFAKNFANRLEANQLGTEVI